MKDKLVRYFRACHPGLYIVSAEEPRVEAEVKAAATEVGRPLLAWSLTTGLVDTASGAARNAGDPVEVLGQVGQLLEGAVILLRDFHLHLDSAPPVVIRDITPAPAAAAKPAAASPTAPALFGVPASKRAGGGA